MLINILSGSIYRFIKRFYWILNLLKISRGDNIKVQFPVIVEGKGFIELGDSCFLGKWSNLGIAKGAALKVKNNFSMSPNSVIKIGSGSLTSGDDVKIENGTRIYINNNWKWGDKITFSTFCQIFSREQGFHGTLNIGTNSHFGDNTIIDVAGNVTIGNNVAVGPNCVFYSHDHIYTDKSKAAWEGGVVTGDIIIDDGAWIGSGVTILPGVRVGKNAVIAAGSVVTKDVDSFSIYGGIPARLIKKI